jgi:hypothetical protein
MGNDLTTAELVRRFPAHRRSLGQGTSLLIQRTCPPLPVTETLLLVDEKITDHNGPLSPSAHPGSLGLPGRGGGGAW